MIFRVAILRIEHISDLNSIADCHDFSTIRVDDAEDLAHFSAPLAGVLPLANNLLAFSATRKRQIFLHSSYIFAVAHMSQSPSKVIVVFPPQLEQMRLPLGFVALTHFSVGARASISPRKIPISAAMAIVLRFIFRSLGGGVR